MWGEGQGWTVFSDCWQCQGNLVVREDRFSIHPHMGLKWMRWWKRLLNRPGRPKYLSRNCWKHQVSTSPFLEQMLQTSRQNTSCLEPLLCELLRVAVRKWFEPFLDDILRINCAVPRMNPLAVIESKGRDWEDFNNWGQRINRKSQIRQQQLREKKILLTLL